MKPPIAKVFTFKSSSGNGQYETLCYADASTSCDCPGWTRRVTVTGERSCKHTRYVDAGIATELCEASKDYGVAIRPKLQPRPVTASLTPVRRRFELESA